MECKQKGRPYCVTFCGVNGVGKSTNLAKVTLLFSDSKEKKILRAFPGKNTR